MGFLHFGPGWLPGRKERSPPQRDAVSPDVFCSPCPNSLSSSAPAAVGCLSPSPTSRNQNPSFPGCHLLATPRLLQSRGHCSICGGSCSSAPCEAAVRLLGRSFAVLLLNPAAASRERVLHWPFCCGSASASASGICRQLLQPVQPAAGSQAPPGVPGEERGQP